MTDAAKKNTPPAAADKVRATIAAELAKRGELRGRGKEPERRERRVEDLDVVDLQRDVPAVGDLPLERDAGAADLRVEAEAVELDVLGVREEVARARRVVAAGEEARLGPGARHDERQRECFPGKGQGLASGDAR